MENHEFIYESMKKINDLQGTKKCPVKEFLYMNSYSHMRSESIYEFIYENIFYEFIYELIYEFMYVNSQNTYTKKYNMAIRVFQIWRSGCSRSLAPRQRRVTESVRWAVANKGGPRRHRSETGRGELLDSVD